MGKRGKKIFNFAWPYFWRPPRSVFLNRRDLRAFSLGLATFFQLWNLPDLLRILDQILYLTLKDALILLEFKRYFYIFEETRVKLQNRGTNTQKKNCHRDLSLLILLPTGTWSPKGWEPLSYITHPSNDKLQLSGEASLNNHLSGWPFLLRYRWCTLSDPCDRSEPQNVGQYYHGDLQIKNIFINIFVKVTEMGPKICNMKLCFL